MNATSEAALTRAVARVRELAASYDPPSFDDVPDADAAIFLCAVDHSTGYCNAHRVDERGPFSGSELMWQLGLRAHGREQGGLLRAERLENADGDAVARWFQADDETVGDPDRRAALWRDLAARLQREYRGAAGALLAATGGRLGGPGGLLARLRGFEAYSDPLAKKAFLFAKICDRRGWFDALDPESWAVCTDNVLMRLALRSGLVDEGPLDQVRADTRRVFGRVARAAGIAPPILDDLLWELGRDNQDLLGREGGDLSEPPRDPASAWY